MQSIGKYAFLGCVKLEEFICPQGLKKIEGETFKNCSSLKTIQFNEGLQEIEDFAFQGCSLLSEELRFPSSLLRMGTGVFYGATYAYIKSIFIGGSMKTINLSLDVPNVEYIHFNEGVEHIDCIVSYGSRSHICQIDFPQTLLSIGSGAFTYCESLKEVILPDSLTQVDRSSFDNDYVRYIVVPGRLEQIFDNFNSYGCTVITTDELRRQEQQEQQRKREENLRRLEIERAKAEREKQRIRRQNGLCEYCGGTFKGMFGKKCAVCGRPKDY